MPPDLNIRLFRKEDFPAYQSWFQDPDLDKQLGPMDDEEWLNYVLEEQKGLTPYKGCTYSFFLENSLVSVVGVAFPDKDHPAFGISSIAVKPTLRSRGMGHRVLAELMKLHPPKKGQYWKAFVDVNNPKAKRFFERNGWKCVGEAEENNNMFLFEYREP